MAEPDEIRRRVERLENIQGELQGLLRDNTSMTARLNETLIELKEEIKDLRIEMKQFRQLEVDVSNLKLGFAAVKWFAATIGGGGLLMVLAYLFKGTVPL